MTSMWARAAASSFAISVAAILSGCESTQVSEDERIFVAKGFCFSGQANSLFESRQTACDYYQSHFVGHVAGNPQDLFDYITANKNLCDMNSVYCLQYWKSVNTDSFIEKDYPGINVRDSRIWAAKRAVMKACLDDSHPVTPDGHDAKADACLQAARLLRGDRLAPEILKKVEHRACDLGEPDECHNATMDGEAVDIKASEAAQSARLQHKTMPEANQGVDQPSAAK